MTNEKGIDIKFPEEKRLSPTVFLLREQGQGRRLAGRIAFPSSRLRPLRAQDYPAEDVIITV